MKIWAQSVVEVARQKKKTPLSHEVVCLLRLDFETSNSKLEVLISNSWEITSVSKNYVTSEGAVSHNVLYYQPLPMTGNQERFYDDNYFEWLPIVSTAFKKWYRNFLIISRYRPSLPVRYKMLYLFLFLHGSFEFPLEIRLFLLVQGPLIIMQYIHLSLR